MKVRKDIFEMHITKKSQTKNSDAMKSFERVHYPPLTIFDFTRKDDAADANLIHHGPTKGGWRYSDDEVIGGYSRGTLQLISKEQSNDNHGDGDDHDHDATNTNDNIPYLHWEGTIDTTIGPKSRAQRSGFCAIRCPEFPFGGVPIGFRYNALEIICRTDGRIYTVNLKVGSYFEDDLYQGVIKIDPTSEVDNEFVTLVLPFRDFVLTSSGLIREQQRDLDGAIQLEHFGLTLMDGVDGPFQFDLARVRAVNYMNGEILGESNDDADDDDEDTVGEEESSSDSDDERDGPVDKEEERKPDRT
jgi:hypothetical protein